MKIARKAKGRTAWVVTWEGVSDNQRVEQPLVTFFNPHWSGKRVQDAVELLYAAMRLLPDEKLSFAIKPSTNPYRATFGDIDGVRWLGHIHCGDHPWLSARIVDDIRTERDTEGKETVVWNERPRPKLPEGLRK
ncbi:MAG: hypothetical protein WCU88_07070 [Elusimicrobiota bacterium]|jgi:hypothetical protein